MLFQKSSDVMLNTLCCCARDRFYSSSRFLSNSRSLRPSIFFTIESLIMSVFFLLFSTFTLRCTICIVILIWWLISSVKRNTFMGLLTFIFNCSPHEFSPSFVSVHFVVFIFFLDWTFSMSWFHLIFLFPYFYLIKVSNKKFITVFLLFNSSCRKEISFSIWWNSFSVVLPPVCIACFCRKSFLNCKTLSINNSLK